jgi:hypothetical protein
MRSDCSTGNRAGWSGGETGSGRGVSLWLTARLFALFGCETILWAILKLPDQMLFRYVVFGDYGSNFTLQFLLRQGLKPGIDFGYHYGLLPALLGRLWFAIAGPTLPSYMAAMLVCGLLIAWATAVVAAEAQLRTPGVLLLVVALPVGIQVAYPNFAHAIEAALLANALAQQARGRLDLALCLSAAAVFSKPALGLVYMLVLLTLVVSRAESWSVLYRPLAPTFFISAGLSFLLSLIYGFSTLADTILPIAGISAYRASNFGHFALDFWWRPDLGWPYYMFTVAGFWILGTFWLISCAIQLAFTALKDRAAQIVVTCAILHLLFIIFMFGNRLSWFYYSHILVVGLALATLYARQWNRIVIPVLTALALSAQAPAIYGHGTLALYVRSAATLGLKAEATEREEWQRAREIAAGHRSVVLAEEGDAGLLFPEFEKPVALYLVPGLMLPGEAVRQAQQISAADIVLTTAGLKANLARIPPLSGVFRDLHEIFAGHYFEAYARRGAPLIKRSAAG